MAATVTKLQLSASTDGSPIALTTSAVTMHTADADATGDVLDTVYAWVTNINSAAGNVTLTVGGVTVGPIAMAADEQRQVAFGDYPLNNSVTFQAQADANSKYVLSGYVNKINQGAP